MKKGKLFLIPTLLSEGDADRMLPGSTLEIIRSLDHFIVEELKTARRLLRNAGMKRDFGEVTFYILNEHTRQESLTDLLQGLMEGHDTGLLSEAGTPCIADPGASIVGLAHEHGITVVPLPGSSSLLLALMASGFNGQRFRFEGYIPVEKIPRSKKIRELEKAIYDQDQTQIFIETPYRNLQVFQALVETCREETRLCIASGLTGPDEKVEVRTIREWKKHTPSIHKIPAVFLLYR
jgi:16S rRNA (cytidine1402-2'-O)-methyltransferase